MDIRADGKLGEVKSGSVRRRLRLRKLLIAGAIVVVLAAIAVFAAISRPKAPEAPAAAEASERNSQLVTVVKAVPRRFVRTALVSGEVRPVEDVNVFAPTTGVRISEVLVEIGDVVDNGQPLARLDAEVADAQIMAAEAEYQEARIEQARAAEEYARIKPIADSGALSKEEVETRRAAAGAADARVAAKKAALTQVNARMQGGYIRAPAAGLVIERNAKIGEIADQKALFRIVGGNRLEVAAAVSEKDILALKAGQDAIFRTGEGAEVHATLRRPAVAVDPDAGTGEALFNLPFGAEVRTGMYLRGEVEVAANEHLAAPQTAISYASGTPSVFVIVDGKARLTPVTLGPRNGDYVAILSGVKEGDEIAASGGAFLLDGDSVRVAASEDAAKANTAAAANRG